MTTLLDHLNDTGRLVWDRHGDYHRYMLTRWLTEAVTGWVRSNYAATAARIEARERTAVIIEGGAK